MKTTLLMMVGLLTGLSCYAAGPKRNPFLVAEKYGITHFDSAQTDLFPYPVKQGTFHADVEKSERVMSGPVNIMTYATTSPNYMWSVSSQGVAYLDVSKGGLKELASLNVPGSIEVSDQALKQGLDKKFTGAKDVENVVEGWKLDWTRITNGVYSFVDKDNHLYYNTSDKKVFIFGLKNPSDPSEGIKIIGRRDFQDIIGEKDMIAGLSMTYDGKLVVLGSNNITVMNRNLTDGSIVTYNFYPDERVTNSVAIDEKNGIYVASDKYMRKLVWNGKKITDDSKKGAWISAYDIGTEPNSVKIGKGTGSTPTLMGYGKNDRLVVITDGADQMKLVAFWRDQIPKGFKQIEGAKTNRIAGQIPVTAGLSPMPKYVQTEQSVVVKDYGAFVVNNIRKEGSKDRLIDVLAGGPVYEPPRGVERFEWNSKTNTFNSVWARNDVVSTSMVPAVSGPSNIVVVNGYTKKDGWEVTGMDWNSGATVHRVIFGQSNFGNGAYAILQYAPNGDLLFNSIAGVSRVHYFTESIRQAEEEKKK